MSVYPRAPTRMLLLLLLAPALVCLVLLLLAGGVGVGVGVVVGDYWSLSWILLLSANRILLTRRRRMAKTKGGLEIINTGGSEGDRGYITS